MHCPLVTETPCKEPTRLRCPLRSEQEGHDFQREKRKRRTWVCQETSLLSCSFFAVHLQLFEEVTMRIAP